MARNVRTMRAQQTTPEEIYPRNLPVPSSVPSPQELQDAINREGARRAREAENARRNAETGRAVRSGAGAGAGFGVVSGAMEGVRVILEEAGKLYAEDQYALTPEEQAANRAREDELRRRTAEEIEKDRLLTGVQLPPGVRRYRDADDFWSDRIRSMPSMPTAPQSQTVTPPAPKRSRARRVLNAVRRATGNRWAIGGVLGLGLLERGRSGNLPSPIALQDAIATDPLPQDAEISGLTAFNAGGVPFVPGVAQLGHCDCKPKKRGPRRECLERAPIRWAGGRRKGKAAGTKCVRWRN